MTVRPVQARPAQLVADDLAALARGAAVLGTGGGGDPYIGRLMAQQVLGAGASVPLVDPADLPEDACVIPVAMMGAPTVMVEKLPSGEQITGAVEAMARYRGLEPTHIACIEAGGLNSTLPIVAAALLGLPLVDGDGMGRAFPELQMVLPALYGVPATPMSIVDEKGNSGVLATLDAGWAERLARVMTVEMGCSAMISLYAMTGAQAKEHLIPGTLSRCLRIGRELEQARRDHRDPVAAAVAELDGVLLANGKVVDVERRTTTGFARGTATLEGVGADRGRAITLSFQNEHLVARVDGVAVATTPDLIMVLDTELGEPVTTEGLRYGQRVSVLAAPADPRWHTPEGIAAVGPRYFGYDLDPVRVPPIRSRPAPG